MARETELTPNLIAGVSYTEDKIQTLRWNGHIRKRPGMYVGTTGDGSDYADADYVLFKEVIDNSANEFIIGYGKKLFIIWDVPCRCNKDYTVAWHKKREAFL